MRLAFLEKWKWWVCGWTGTAQCLQPSEEFVPENQSAYYSFIKEACYPKKKKEEESWANTVTLWYDCFPLGTYSLFFFGFIEIYKEYWRSRFKIISKFDILLLFSNLEIILISFYYKNWLNNNSVFYKCIIIITLLFFQFPFHSCSYTYISLSSFSHGSFTHTSAWVSTELHAVYKTYK